MQRSWGGRLLAGAALAWMAASGARAAGQSARQVFGTLDEHPAIQYEHRLPTDRVGRLSRALASGTQSLAFDPQTGYLRGVLDALGLSVDSQLLVFSKTGVQRDVTGPRNPRALYFDDAVVVGYIRGAPMLELAAHDPQQGVVFYTLDQREQSSPALVRRTECLTCHIALNTLEVPGMIDRSHTVGPDGDVLLRLGVRAVNHRTPHTERWGGWFVTAAATPPPYIQLGHMGNMTATLDEGQGPAIYSNHVLIEWLNRAPEALGYPSSSSDAAALQAFDHQTYAINLMTRINWEARIAASEGRAPEADAAQQDRIVELADYLLFAGEAPLAVPVTPRPGFAAALAARVPSDARGRSFGELDLETRLLKYPCSYMIYTDAFDGLPAPVRDAVFRRMFDVLSGRVTGPQFAHLTADLRRAIIQILRDTKPGLPAGLFTNASRTADR